MGQYAYLINRKTKIYCESHKISGGGHALSRIEEPESLCIFLEHCRENNLSIECVSEQFIEENFEYNEHNETTHTR